VRNEITGSGSISTSQGFASFTVNTQRQPGKRTHHHFDYRAPAGGTSINSDDAAIVSIVGSHAKISGTSKNGRRSTFRFTVDVDDLSPSGGTDQLAISVNNGYSAGGPLTRGDISIH
jgi:hypothetical protein